MQRMPRLVLGLIVALALALTGPGTVGAGQSAPGLLPMVICGTDGTQTLWIDAQGNPADPADHCPDCPICLIQVPAALPDMPVAAHDAADAANRLVHPRHRAPAIGPARHDRPEARGPPPASGPMSPCPDIGLSAVRPASLEFGQVIRGATMPDRRHPTKDAC